MFRIHQLNIFKKIKKDSKKQLVKDFLRIKRKAATIWSCTIQKYTKR